VKLISEKLSKFSQYNGALFDIFGILDLAKEENWK
jgi:hypothetical protein